MKTNLMTVMMLLCLWQAAIFAQTDSCAITQLPFVENFDSLPVGNIGNNPCWISSPVFVDQSPCVYAPSWAGGNKCLWLRSYSQTSMVVFPPISEYSINTLMMSMNVRTNNYVELFEVGVMTDPNDFSTFVPVDTIKDFQLNHFELHRVYFNNYADTGRYIAFRWFATDVSYYDYYAYVDDIVVDFGPSCAVVEHLRVQDITGHSARISWDNGPVGNPVNHQIECFNTLDSTILYFYTISGEELLLDGLNPSTPYVAKVFSYCDNGSVSDVNSISFTTQCPSGGDLVFGQDDYSQARSFPNHKHSVTEEIYTASDLGGARWLNSMSLRCATANSNRNVAIYLMKVEEETLTHLVNVTSDAVKVYDGLVPVTAGWMTIPFFHDYYYDGTSNLLMVIHDKTNAYGANSPNAFFCMSEPTGNAVFVAKNDNIGINPMYAANFNGTIYHFRHQIIFGDVCDNTPDCVAPYANVTNITSTSANVELLPGASENAWRVEYRKSSDTLWTVMDTVYSTSFQLNSLNPNSRYLVRIRPLCSDTLEHWATRTFTTECGPLVQVPICYSFEENLSLEEGSAFPSCWQRHSSSESTTVSVVTDVAQAYSGERFLHFPAITDGATYAVLPEMATNITIDSLQVKCYLSHNGSGSLEIGVMSDPMDTASFVSLGQITPFAYGAYEMVSYPLNGYNGTGRYVAFRVTGATGDGIRIDDLTLDYPNGCFVPLNVTVEEVEPFSATIGWQEFGASQEWEIEYSTVNFTPGAGTRITAMGNPWTLTGLQADHNYYFYVRSKCDTDSYSDWTNIYTFTTPCYEIDHFPFTENFNNGTHDLPECWGGVGTQYLEVQFGNMAPGSGGYLCFIYYAGIAVMPRLADYDTNGNPIDIRYLKLNLDVNYYDNDDHVTVGVMTDPNDASTFMPVKEINVGYDYSTNFRHDSVFFFSYTGTGRYIAVKNNYASYAAVDNFVLTQFNYDCAPPANLSLEQVSSGSALVTWQAGAVGDAQEYTLQYSTRGDSAWTTIDHLTTPSFFLTGLTPRTWYDVRVKSFCSDSTYGDWAITSFQTECFSGGYDTIGNSPNHSNWMHTWDYSVTRQLYFPEEIGGSGNLYSVSFHVYHPTILHRDWKLFLQYTNQSDFYFPDPTPFDNLPSTQVYAGTVDFHDGWVTLYFDTPFYYNGTSNLVLTIQDTTGTAASPSNHFYYGYCSHIATATGHVNTLDAPFTSNMNVWMYDQGRLDVIFQTDCDASVTCGAPNLLVDSVGGNGARLIWAAAYQENQWELEYKATTDTVWTTYSNPTGFQVTLTGLLMNTSYTVRMRSVCDTGNYSEWTTRSFMTGCGDIVQIPYEVDFETFVPIGLQNYVECWQRLEQTAYVVNGQGTTPDVTNNHCLQMTYNASTQPYALAILPRLDSTFVIQDLAVILNMKSVNGNSILEVGLMDDAMDTASFVIVDTLMPSTNSWSQVFIPLASYAGNGRHIALRVRNGSLYVDDLQLREESTCESPINIVVGNVSNESADLSWTDVSGTTIWMVEYGTTGFAPGTGVQLYVTNPNVSLTGLLSATTYTVYVSADCGNTVSDLVSVEFTTLCGDVPLPYYQDFENSGTFPECWSMQYVNGTRNWSVVTPQSNPTGAHSGTKAISLKNNSYTPETTMLVTPQLRLLDVNQPRLRFWHTQAKWGNDQDTLMILYRTSETDPWTAITHYSNNIPTWTVDSLLLPNPTNTYQIAFQGTVRWGYGIYLDDVTVLGDAIVEPDPCDTPSSLTVDEIGNEYLTVDWAQDGEYDYWAVMYRPLETPDWDTLLTTVHPVTINGLQGLTTYEIYVVNYCEDGIPANSDTIAATTMNFGIADYDRYVKIYPNPTTDVINVECTMDYAHWGGAIEVVDVFGKTVVGLPHCDSPTARIDISDLAASIYFVRIATDRGMVTKPFVKQ
ncbi:MAG: fibronectin type III domain-containing protein [Bacteroidales bacterium]|nr:fibronectin type III domain-containing protein [Bacteroidales bacterium]